MSGYWASRFISMFIHMMFGFGATMLSYYVSKWLGLRSKHA